MAQIGFNSENVSTVSNMYVDEYIINSAASHFVAEKNHPKQKCTTSLTPTTNSTTIFIPRKGRPLHYEQKIPIQPTYGKHGYGYIHTIHPKNTTICHYTTLYVHSIKKTTNPPTHESHPDTPKMNNINIPSIHMGNHSKNVEAEDVATAITHTDKDELVGKNNYTNFTHNKVGIRHRNIKWVYTPSIEPPQHRKVL